MKSNDDISYAITPKDVTALARVIIAHTDGQETGRTTYLRSLLAGVQIELIGRPVLRTLKAHPKPPDIETSRAAFAKVNAVYYEAVLAAIPDGLNAQERHSKTGFARSAASSLRRAIGFGWNPLTPIHATTKVALSRYIAEHREPRTLTREQAQARVLAFIEKARAAASALSSREASAMIRAAIAEVVPPQRATSVSLRAHKPPERAAAH